jgi:hypothetical protein
VSPIWRPYGARRPLAPPGRPPARCVREAPEPLEAVKQAVLGGSDAPLVRDRVGAGEFGEAQGALLEDSAHQQGEVGLLGGSKEGGGGADSGPGAVVP